MTNRVYPIGYSNNGHLVEQLMQNEKALLIDTRYSPNSRMSAWTGHALQRKYGDRYRKLGQFLGNVNFRGGPILIAHPDAGIEQLIQYLDDYDLILLCQCPEFSACHRSVIVDLLLQQVIVEVVYPEQIIQLGIIKAISVRQPYATWIANPQRFTAINMTPKRIENRDWYTEYRGPILIHASKTFEKDAIPFWISRFPRLGDAFSLNPKDYPLGAIVGRAELTDVITSLENALHEIHGFAVSMALNWQKQGLSGLFPIPASKDFSMSLRVSWNAREMPWSKGDCFERPGIAVPFPLMGRAFLLCRE